MSALMSPSSQPMAAVQPKRFEQVTGSARVMQWWRLFELELRRSPGLIGAVAIVVATYWMMWQELPNGVVYWEAINRSAGVAMAPVAAITGGVAAWAASREHRRHTAEQINTTSFPRGAQQAMAVLAVTIWSITGYLVVAMSFYGYATTKATWAGPEWDFLVIVVGAIIGSAGFGWLIGTIWPRPMAPVLIIGVIWGGDLLWEITNGLRDIIGRSMPGGSEMGPEGGYLNSPTGLDTFFQKDGAWRFLIPSEYQRTQMAAMHVTGWAVLWMVGLGVSLFWIANWWKRRTIAPLIIALITLIVASSGGLGAAAKYDYSWGIHTEQNPPETCTTRLDGTLTVCLHEKQEALLPETADIIAKLLGPIAGRPWVPMRWESGSTEVRGDLAEGIALMNFYDRDEIENLELHQRILMNLLSYPGGSYFGLSGGDYVVMTWLLEEAGISREDAISRGILLDLPVQEVRQTVSRTEMIPDPVYLDASEVDAAIERFLALSPEERDAWLDANWPEVFMGTLSLEDLP